MARKKIPLGHCYEFAFRLAVKHANKPTVRLVHGTVHDRFSGEIYRHAWVELRGHAFDWQTKETKPSGIPLAVFYEIFQPSDMTVYTAHHAVERAVKTGHAGPWRARRRRSSRGPGRLDGV